MKAHNFSKKVRQRSQRIVTESRFRAQGQTEQSRNVDESGPVVFLRHLFRRLPSPVQQTIQSLVSDDAQIEHVRRLLRQAHEHRRELNERESLLERQVREVQSERKSLQEMKLSLRARLKNLTPTADYPKVGEVVRVPLSQVKYTIEDAPRPPSEINRLSQNLKRFGQQTPVVCYYKEGRYVLISGYRRMVALEHAEFTHVDVRITAELDPETAAALYIAENCLVRGVSLSEVRRLEMQVKERQGFLGPIRLLKEDDDALEEEMTLADVAEETRHHLSEAAAWIAALRPHWRSLNTDDKSSLVALIRYLAHVAKTNH